MKHLPNLLTLANLFLGSMAVVCILQSPGFVASYNGQDYVVSAPPLLSLASWLIAGAAVMDFLDGLAARLLKAGSAMGRELDSLADVVSFGLAPSLLLYQLLRSAYMMQPDALDVSSWKLYLALILPCFAAWRLARYNLGQGSDDHFEGLPAPAAGLFLASLPLAMLHGSAWLSAWLSHPWVLYLLEAVLAYLMVSRIPFFNLKPHGFSLKGDNLLRLLVLLFALVTGFWLHAMALPIWFAFYLVLALGRYLFS